MGDCRALAAGKTIRPMKRWALVLVLACQSLPAIPQQPIQNAEAEEQPPAAEESAGTGKSLLIGVSVVAGVGLLVAGGVVVACGGESCDDPIIGTIGTTGTR